MGRSSTGDFHRLAHRQPKVCQEETSQCYPVKLRECRKARHAWIRYTADCGTDWLPLDACRPNRFEEISVSQLATTAGNLLA